MTLTLNQKEKELVKDVLEEAKAISEQLKTQVPESQRNKFKQQAKDLDKIIKKL